MDLIHQLKQNDPTFVDLYLTTSLRCKVDKKGKEDEDNYYENITDAIRSNKTIKSVFIRNNCAFLDLRESNHDLLLQKQKQHDIVVFKLFDAIGRLPELEEIYISFATIPMKAFANCLRQSKQLKVLHLRHTKFTGTTTDDDLAEFYGALTTKCLPSLREFHLSVSQADATSGATANNNGAVARINGIDNISIATTTNTNTDINSNELRLDLDPMIKALSTSSSASCLEEIYISMGNTNNNRPATDAIANSIQCAISIPAVSALMKVKSLRRLSLLGCKFGEEHCQLVADALMKEARLTYLNLSNLITVVKHRRRHQQEEEEEEEEEAETPSPSLLLPNNNDKQYEFGGIQKIAYALTKNKMLKSLCLANNELSDQDVTEIANALRINTTLEGLDLHNTTLTGEGGENSTMIIYTLTNALKVNSTLKMLDLSHNNLMDNGGIAVACALACNVGLERLYLVGCNLTDTSCFKISNALGRNQYLKMLNLNLNTQISCKSIDSFIQTVKHQNFTIEKLDVSFNRGKGGRKERGGEEEKKKNQLEMYLKLNRFGRYNLLCLNHDHNNCYYKVSANDWIEKGLGRVANDLNSLFYYLSLNPTLCNV